MVIRSRAVIPVIIVIAVEPRADREARAERDDSRSDRRTGRNALVLRHFFYIFRGLFYIHRLSIVFRNIYDLGLGRFDADDLILNYHLLLGRCSEISCIAGLRSQSLQ